jgi:hemerythrin
MPQLIEWRDEFRTGLQSVDYEHRELIRTINDLHGEAALHADKAAAEAVLGDIHSGISAHFALEEKLMHDMGYRDYAAHKAEHETLLDAIRAIMDQVHADPVFDYRIGLENQLRHWFGHNLLGADAKLHRATA